jgi:hypothetical protein
MMKKDNVGIYSTIEFLLKGHFANKIFQTPDISSNSYRTVTDCGEAGGSVESRNELTCTICIDIVTDIGKYVLLPVHRVLLINKYTYKELVF